jgi:DNA-binding beta-propeller fold protein YncE
MTFPSWTSTGRSPARPSSRSRHAFRSRPFGIAASPDGKLVAVTSRQNNIAGIDGNTISLIDVDRARQGLPGAEAARVPVGADRPDQPTRPFSVAWTPDGGVVVANFRTNTMSVVDVRAALAGQGGAEVARIGLDRADGAPARPKIVAVTRDGRYAVVTGGDDTLATSTTRATGMVYFIDLRTRTVAAQVTGVGIDPYGITVVDDAQ